MLRKLLTFSEKMGWLDVSFLAVIRPEGRGGGLDKFFSSMTSLTVSWLLVILNHGKNF